MLSFMTFLCNVYMQQIVCFNFFDIVFYRAFRGLFRVNPFSELRMILAMHMELCGAEVLISIPLI